MKAENDQATKLTCPKCSTEICFKCRNNWHGDISCEDALKEQFSGWAKENQFIKDNISFCPMCRTKIEKNAGCNHMTCQVCKYEFCWACGASASNAENHFDPYNPKSCGVKMMDETVKPNTKKSGEGEKKTMTCSLSLCIFIKCLLILFFFYPIFIVIGLPLFCFLSCCVQQLKASGNNYCLAFTFAIAGFVCGIPFLICWIPLAILQYIIVFIKLVITWFKCMFCWGCICQDPKIVEKREEEAGMNRRRAEEEMNR